MRAPGDEGHVYTDPRTHFSVFKIWDLLGPLTSPYYKLYDAGGDYVRRYDSRSEAIAAAKKGDD